MAKRKIPSPNMWFWFVLAALFLVVVYKLVLKPSQIALIDESPTYTESTVSNKNFGNTPSNPKSTGPLSQAATPAGSKTMADRISTLVGKLKKLCYVAPQPKPWDYTVGKDLTFVFLGNIAPKGDVLDATKPPLQKGLRNLTVDFLDAKQGVVASGSLAMPVWSNLDQLVTSKIPVFQKNLSLTPGQIAKISKIQACLDTSATSEVEVIVSSMGLVEKTAVYLGPPTQSQ